MTIGCPSCRRRLNLPRFLEGQSVQCPGCGHAFAATAELVARVTPSIPEPPALPPPPIGPRELEVNAPAGSPRPGQEGEAPCPFCQTFVDRESIRCPHCRRRLVGLAGGPFWMRRDCEPHRGGLIQALGIGSLLLSIVTVPATLISWGVVKLPVGGVVGLLALVLGAVAWTMASADLKRMDDGVLDALGRSRTATGRQCGLLGVIFSLMCGTGCGLLALVPLLARL